MSWFDEQIRLRKQNDQEVFEDSIFRMASAVIGKSGADRIQDIRYVTKAAIEDILKYYGFRGKEINLDTDDPEEALELSLRPFGIMYRQVRLSGEWYKDGFGPMMAYIGDAPAALIPGEFGGYTYKDPASGETIKVGKENADKFSEFGVCFYKPLPQKSIGIKELLLYMKECMNASDVTIFVALAFLEIVIGMAIPHITKLMTGFVPSTGKISLLWGTAALLIGVSISSNLIKISNEFMKSRIQAKTSISVEAAIMMRLMSLPAQFFKKYSAGELSKRSEAINMLCELLIGDVFAITVSSAMSVLYIFEIYSFAPALAAPAVMVIALTVILSMITVIIQRRITGAIMQAEAKDNGLSFQLLSGIQKIKLAGAEKRAFSKWVEGYRQSAELTYNPPVFIKLKTSLSLAITLIGTIVIFNLAVVSGVTQSEYIAFNSAFGLAMGSFMLFEQLASSIAQIGPILDMAKPILKAVPETSEEKRIVTEISGAVELSGVYFRYAENLPYILKDINLKIKPGEYVAIVGKTGCGKSTLMRILL